VMLPVAVWRAHQHAVEQHRRAMLGLFFGGLVIAGWARTALRAVPRALLRGGMPPPAKLAIDS
jgi:uncharacterized membrane protein